MQSYYQHWSLVMRSTESLPMESSSSFLSSSSLPPDLGGNASCCRTTKCYDQQKNYYHPLLPPGVSPSSLVFCGSYPSMPISLYFPASGNHMAKLFDTPPPPPPLWPEKRLFPDPVLSNVIRSDYMGPHLVATNCGPNSPFRTTKSWRSSSQKKRRVPIAVIQPLLLQMWQAHGCGCSLHGNVAGAVFMSEAAITALKVRKGDTVLIDLSPSSGV